MALQFQTEDGDEELRRFPSAKALATCYESCGGDANHLVFSDSSQPYSWKVYFIWNGKVTYCGKTNDVHRRWREHNGYKSGGGGFTSSRKRQGWTLLCVLDGFRTAGEALQFEDRCHQRTIGHLEVDEERQAKTSIAMTYAQIRIAYLTIMFKVLNMTKWQDDAPLACTRPLRVNWFDTRFMPNIHLTDYYPDYVTQRVVTDAERSYILDFRPREKIVVTDYKRKRKRKDGDDSLAKTQKVRTLPSAITTMSRVSEGHEQQLGFEQTFPGLKFEDLVPLAATRDMTKHFRHRVNGIIYSTFGSNYWSIEKQPQQSHTISTSHHNRRSEMEMENLPLSELLKMEKMSQRATTTAEVAKCPKLQTQISANRQHISSQDID